MRPEQPLALRVLCAIGGLLMIGVSAAILLGQLRDGGLKVIGYGVATALVFPLVLASRRGR